MQKKAAFSVKRKNRNKIIRVIFQVVTISLMLLLIIRALFFGPRYQTPAEAVPGTADTGFIALSYFGVNRGDSVESIISTVRLDEHLKALFDAGYVTVSQQDVLEYYQNGKLLPQKSLFLIFEDGRRDTAIFAQPMLEKYNFRATALTYADNLINDYQKFLNADDINKLRESTFWELGSNGYRLAYINAFDRYGNFLDVLNTSEFQMISPYIDRRYDHYLMDFIRDEYAIPKETPDEMRQRISFDYEKMRQVYEDELGAVPAVYSIMHANSNYFGTNEKAGSVNAEWIPALFAMNFNREGDCLNTNQSSVYDLTRMQPSPFWYTNHLLMRIRDDTGLDLQFVTGDAERGLSWDILAGAAEFKQEKIVLTSLPRGKGIMRWNEGNPKDLRITANLDGNKAGGQSVYMRADEGLDRYIAVRVKDNVFSVTEKSPDNAESVLFEMDLNQFDGVYVQSLEENRRDAEARKLEIDARYAETAELAQNAAVEMTQRKNAPAKTVEEGAEEYLPPISINEHGHRKLDITLFSGELTVLLDDRAITEALPVTVDSEGHVVLETSDKSDGFSERKLSDEVYDGVFTDLVIYSVQSRVDDEPAVIYDNRLSGMEKVMDILMSMWNSLVDWFINTL